MYKYQTFLVYIFHSQELVRRFTILDIFNENVFFFFIAFEPVYVKINQGYIARLYLESEYF